MYSQIGQSELKLKKNGTVVLVIGAHGLSKVKHYEVDSKDEAIEMKSRLTLSIWNEENVGVKITINTIKDGELVECK